MKRDRGRNPANKGQRTRPDTGYIYLVKNPASNEASICAWDSVLYPGTSVVIPTRYGLDLGLIIASADQLGQPYEPGSLEFRGACNCSQGEESHDSEEEILFQSESDEHPCECCDGCNPAAEAREVPVAPDVLWIDRLATPSDLNRYQEMAEKEDEAMRICREKIALHKLDMKLVTAHYLLGEAKIIFFFTADVRVDFRELVKDLVSVFKIRIELRQIGVRDESRVLGGLAVCGRDFCCHSVTDKLNPVSIKMAKEQNLSLNPAKISGVCGRLMCCLRYEYEAYKACRQGLPKIGQEVRTAKGTATVVDLDILRRLVRLDFGDGEVLTVSAEEIIGSDSKA